MSILYHTQDCRFSLQGKRKVSSWILQVASIERRQVGDLSIIFCSDMALLAINKQFLNHDYLTDIITFDYSEGNTISGDLMISIETVKSNATLYGVAFFNELMRVIIHGVLHLCGYGDKSPVEKALMRQLEDKYLTIR